MIVTLSMMLMIFLIFLLFVTEKKKDFIFTIFTFFVFFCLIMWSLQHRTITGVLDCKRPDENSKIICTIKEE